MTKKLKVVDVKRALDNRPRRVYIEPTDGILTDRFIAIRLAAVSDMPPLSAYATNELRRMDNKNLTGWARNAFGAWIEEAEKLTPLQLMEVIEGSIGGDSSVWLTEYMFTGRSINNGITASGDNPMEFRSKNNHSIWIQRKYLPIIASFSSCDYNGDNLRVFYNEKSNGITCGAFNIPHPIVGGLLDSRFRYVIAINKK